MRLKLSLRKILTVTATIATLVNSLGAPLTVLAQEVTPAPTQEATPIPTDQPTLAPSDTPTATPDASPDLLTPTPEVTVEPSPVATDPVTPTPDLTQPETQGTTSENTQSQAPPSDNTTATPTATPEIPQEHGTLTTTTVENVDLSEVTLLNSEVDGNSNIVTDKADYAPTDVVLITGTGFTANKDYTLQIVSTDQPPVDFRDQVKADNSGNISYAYQLDGNYRPNYSVFVKSGEVVVASTTFTDSPISGTTVDSAGANDEPGQKDLTKMSVNYAGLPTSIAVTWNWDEINGSGNNTYDACSLYDTDSDGFANYSTCVTVKGSPLAQTATSPRIYSCSDSKADRCANAALVAGPYNTSCSVSQTSTDPFSAGDVYPQDTTASCTIRMTEVGGVSSSLLDVCSYPSQEPNSDPSDCIVFRDNSGKLEVIKDLIPSSDSGKFNLQIDGVTQAADQGDGGTTGEKVVAAGNRTVGETAGTATSLSTYSAAIVCKDLHGTGTTVASGSNSGPLTVPVAEGDDIVCTITNTVLKGTLVVHKTFTDQHSNSGITINVTGGASLQGTTNGSGDATFSNLTPGTYSATAVEPTGYYESGTTCTNVSVTAGQTANCTITDSPILGTITVHKVIVGTSTAFSNFCFTLSPDPSKGQVCANVNGDAVFSNVPAGTYTASETATATNYTQTDTTCNTNMVIANNGDSKSCTVTNTRNQGKIELQKDFVGTPENVTIKIGTTQNGSNLDSDVLSADGSDGEHTVDTGTFYVSETLTTPSNYASGLVCYNDVNDSDTVDQGDTTHTVNTTTGAVAVSTSDDVLCVFTNTRNTGSVKVNKLADTDGNGSFETTNPGTFNWSLDASGTNAMGSTVSGVDTGSHNVNENSVTDYHLVGWYPGGVNSTQYSCTNLPEATAYHSLPASVSVTTNTTTEITICNARDTGTVIVHKDVVNPDGGAVTDTSHNFGVSLDSANEQTLTDGGTVTFNNVVTGSHTITESTVPSDYSLDSITPDSDNGVTGAQISVVSGQTTHVYVVNKQKKATITVYKVVVLADGKTEVLDGHTFNAQLNGGSDQEFSVGDETSYSVNPGGPYTIGEAAEDNYTNLGCKLDSGAPATEMTLASNQSVSVTCTNQQNPGSISGHKFQADGSTPISGWVIGLFSCLTAYDNCDTFVTSANTDANGFYSFTNLIKGFYQIVENSVNGYTPVSTTFYNTTIDAEQGLLSSTSNDFSNFKNINITVCKKIDADGNLNTENDQTSASGWEMTLYSDGKKLGDSQNTDTETGCATFENLGPDHDYSVTETVTQGWYNLTPLSHDFGTPEDGVDENYTFINAQLATLGDTIYQDNNTSATQDAGEPGIAGITVNLYKDDGNGIFDPGITDPYIGTETTDGSGQYLFSGLEGGDYWVKVDTSTLPFGFTLTTANDPYLVTLVPGDNFVDADFGYVPPIKEISIEKSNDSANTSSGATVTYTLTLHNTGNVALNNVSITDVIPGGFSYVSGSTSGATTSDPTINGSVLSWDIGTVNAGDSATIQYKIKLANDLNNGTYTNFATCTASYGRFVEDQFRVLDTIDCNTASSTVTLGSGVSFGGNLGQVLGLSTELPATGSPTALALIALGLIGVGFILKKKYVKS